MNQSNNVIENENVSITTNYISNVNVPMDKYARSRNVERIADILVTKLNVGISSRPFMCKAALTLSEDCIWKNLEIAQKTPKNPIGLFIYLCKRDGV